ncbi:MAG: SDR family oxidoreductase [Hyphomicrobiaceae bacterium]|nr:SDR family oxidoreductase [Hyphomicrobiaceae bacterium]
MTQNKIALVSGGNRGIGLEIVKQLARLGIVAAIGARDPEKGQAAAGSLASEGLDAPVVRLDVANPASCRAAVEEVAGMFGRLDILVNNAGVLISRDGPDASVFTVSPDAMLMSYLTNTLGPLFLIQAAAPIMRKQDYGRIVNLSSGLGQLSEMEGGLPAYRFSKAALNALTRTTAAELQGTNVKVNSMCPGWVKTEMGGGGATREVEEGAATAVWLATLDNDGPTGGFFRDKKPIPW